jgi:hypothetical protein
MFLGADVTHAAALPGQRKVDDTEKTAEQIEEKKKKPDMPSIAAVVASMDL